MRVHVLTELIGGLWHTTHPDRFESILRDGAILPEPGISDSERWMACGGRDFYPYVRFLGGVSLFDFHQFDKESYSENYPLSSWYEFVPYRRKWGQSVWIEIDRAQVETQMISAATLVEKWNTEGAYRHTIMPFIEAAHIGPIPCKVFKRAFLVREGSDQIYPLSV